MDNVESSDEEDEEEWAVSKNFVPLFSGPLPYNMYKINKMIHKPYNYR